MTTTVFHLLADRGVIRVTGDDAAHLLDGLITNSLSRLQDGGALHAGLLSPQGKILFDFFLVQVADGFLIETSRAQIPDLVKRLTLYRLRSKVVFEDLGDDVGVAAAWGDGADGLDVPDGVTAYRDPRYAALGLRLIGPAASLAALPFPQVDEAAYRAHRIALGVPEAGADYVVGDTFPHEAMYDQLGSVDFKKGCFVGQEVVSRMQHRGTSRKRIVIVDGAGALAPGEVIKAGGETIGTLGSTDGAHGLALVRLDRAHAAEEKSAPLVVGEVAVTLAKPGWAHIDMATGRDVSSDVEVGS